MIKVILSGCGGQMGKVIAALAKEYVNLKIVCGVDIGAPECDFEVYKNINEYHGKADVIIDFSHPDAFESLEKYCLETKTALIMCTTGLSKSQHEKLKAMSETVPVFFSANMSIGVNLLIELVKKATKTLYGDFDIEIVEKHHNKKIDAPSGTALAIADAINSVVDETAEYTYDRHSQRRKRRKNEIGIHAVRGGNIVGDHSVIFAGMDEIIEINHHASSKEIFARGALSAAEFMYEKTPGMYNMTDMVGNN